MIVENFAAKSFPRDSNISEIDDDKSGAANNGGIDTKYVAQETFLTITAVVRIETIFQPQNTLVYPNSVIPTIWHPPTQTAMGTSIAAIKV